MTNLLIALGLLLFAITSFYKRERGIYLIILLLPAYQIRFQVFGIPATFLEGMILILAAVEFITVIRNPHLLSPLCKGEKEGVIRNIFISLFLLAAGISVLVAPDLTRAAGIFKAYFFEAILFYFLVRLIIDSREKQKKIFHSLTLLVLYLSLFGLYQFVTLYNLPPSWWAVEVSSRRITSLLNHPNAVALLLGPILAMLILLPKTKLRWAAIIFGLAAFYLSFSRAGWLALIVVVFGLNIFAKLYNPLNPPYIKGEVNTQSPPLKLRGGWVGLSLSIIVIAILAIPFSRTKLLELTRRDDPSKQNRIVLWSAAADIIKNHPITGVGLMGFREAYKNYPLGPDRVVQNYPHNFFLNFWLETGLLGLLSMIGLLILFFQKIYKTITSSAPPHEEGIKTASPPREGETERGLRNYTLAIGAGMVMIIAHSLVDVSYFKNDLAILFWLIYALPFIQR